MSRAKSESEFGLKLLDFVSFALLATTAGACVAPGLASEENQETVSSAALRDAGALTLSLRTVISSDRDIPFAFQLAKPSETTRDEFVRAGAKLTLRVPTYELWANLYPDRVEPYDDIARVSQVKLDIRIQGFAKGAPVSDVTMRTEHFSGGDGRTSFDMEATTDAYVVPSVDTLKLTATLIDERDGTSKSFPWGIQDAHVFGADANVKTCVFDENAGARRERVIEDGDVAGGDQIRVAYSEWRSDNIARRYDLEGAGKRYIGRGKNSGGRDIVTDVLGPLVNDVTMGVSFDGTHFNAEEALAASPMPRLLGYPQETLEKTISLPATATKLQVYFHVKTYVVATYNHGQYHDVTLRLPEGSRELVGERWDNRGGVSGANYPLW